MKSSTSHLSLFAVFAAALAAGFHAPTNDRIPEIRFADVAQTSGLHFQHRNSATPTKYLIETMTGGAAVLDFDNDGWLDVFFVNGARLQNPQADGEVLDKSAPEFWNRLFRNNHDGTFTDVTSKAGLQGKGYGMGATVGDYDNDGFADLFLTNLGDSILYHNNGDGTFSDVTSRAQVKTEGWTTSAGFFDFDNDGDLDLFICRYLQWDFKRGSIFCGTDQPKGRAYCHPDKFPPTSNYLFRNNGDGTFADISEVSGIGKYTGKGLGVAFADYNRDGWLDVSVANDSYPQLLLKNNGDGTFAEVGGMAGVAYTDEGKTFAGMGTDFADVDNDGYPDIVTTALPYQYFAYFHNERDGSFSYATLTSNLGRFTRLFSGWGMRILDYDNDGRKDLFVANSHVMDNIEVTQPHLSYRQRPLLLRNTGDLFVEVSSSSGEVFSQAWASRGAAFGDLDNDGDLDVVVTNCNEKASILRNDGGNHNHWIALELRGRRSNRDGIGAQVSLTSASGSVQHNMVSTAASYLSANDRRVFFGLGGEGSIQHIQIRWPSGQTQRIDHPKADQFLKIEEDRGAVGRAPAAAFRKSGRAAVGIRVER